MYKYEHLRVELSQKREKLDSDFKWIHCGRLDLRGRSVQVVLLTQF